LDGRQSWHSSRELRKQKPIFNISGTLKIKETTPQN
jgi:hypothetical protein